jgi:hypothetical protein
MAVRRERHGPGISRILFFHSSASDAAHTSSNDSITSATGVRCFTRNTPALEPPASRNSGFRGGQRQHLGIGNPCQVCVVGREKIDFGNPA